MTTLSLLRRRRFLPLFVTQLLNAFNDNLFKQAMILFVTYQVLNDPSEEQQFNAIATGIFVLPFFALSALAGQAADARDKAWIIRWVKTAEIFIMLVGATGLLLGKHPLGLPLMLAALLGMGIHSTFFGPIKYAILPQHLKREEVLAGTGLVEAGTYLSILAGTITAGFVASDVRLTATMVLVIAFMGFVTSRFIPPAPPIERHPIDPNVVRASITLVRNTMHVRPLFLAIISISFFWTIGSVLFIEFPPIVKNVLTADEAVTSLLLAIFSVGVAIGSVIINSLLKGRVSAKYSPPAVILMGVFVLLFYVLVQRWQPLPEGQLYDFWSFLALPGAATLLLSLLLVAVAGGVFVVPLYAFLTTTVPKSQTARTVAANNIVNCGAMLCGAVLTTGLTFAGISATDQLIMVAAMCLISAWLGLLLYRSEDPDAIVDHDGEEGIPRDSAWTDPPTPGTSA